MNIILLSGGSGKRLWPLSNDIRSKQFIKIFKKPCSTDDSGEYESMVQRIFHQIKMVDPDSVVTIATSKSQVSAIHNQLGEEVGISVEPCRRDTFAAIVLATAYLHDVKGMDRNEAVVVCPVDPYVEEEYFRCIRKLYEAAETGEANLVLMGIEPTYPSEKYGYIIPISATDDKNQKYKFTEKPDEKAARQYIEENALWNGGVFAYKLSYVLDKSRELLGTDDYNSLYASYKKLRKISFDYAVVEAEKSISVITYSGTWKDLGTWNTLTEAMEEDTLGDVRLSSDCENVNVVNELGIPILGMGLSNVIIAASPEGILISDKHQSSFIKPYVDDIHQPIKFAEKSWGSYRVLDIQEKCMTVLVTLNPGHKMNYHSHAHRNEVWTITDGNGKTVVDGMVQLVQSGDVITMAMGCRHTVVAGEKGLQLIEVQLGNDISVSDKKKFEMPIGLELL